MAKTAHDETADRLDEMAMDLNGDFLPGGGILLEELAKRLRAEGRKIRRYERLICKTVEKLTDANISALEREAARIQKARTKK